MLDRITTAARWTVLCAVAVLMAACGGGGGGGGSSSDTSSTTSTDSAPPVTTSGSPPTSTTSSVKLTLSGVPAVSVVAGSAYSFEPAVSQTSGTVQFSISGIPAWAAFDPATGALSGVPTSADEGTSGAIIITASDNGSSASIGPFTIDVTTPPSPPPGNGSGSTTLTWAPPAENTDGSPVNDLAGYIIKYGTSVDAMTETISVSSPSTTSYEISNLAPGTYYFEIVAYYSNGTQSAASNVGGLVI